ncbi:MAG TPA: SRPBCC family protein, partial [Nitrospiria bacterium]|nr:SRPBCC family protein [Nitrospiria bacterium]
MITNLILPLIILSGIPANAGELSEPSVPDVVLTVTRETWPIALSAELDIPASPEKVWKTLADYDHLPDFLPKMKTSRMISRRDHNVVVEQSSETRFFFFRKTIAVTLNILEKPIEEIAFSNLDGNMELFSGKWLLKGSEDGKSTQLRYQLEFKPSFFAPRWIVRHTIEREVAEQLQLISKEAQKR